LRLLQSCPAVAADPAVVDGVAYLWLDLTNKLFHGGASDPTSWLEKESPNTHDNIWLLSDARELFTKAERYFSTDGDGDHTDVHERVELALEKVLEICIGSDDSSRDSNGNYYEPAFFDDDDEPPRTRLGEGSIIRAKK